MAAHASPGTPSPWVCRWARLLRPGGSVLDLACGSGRHLRWLAGAGFAVTGVDRSAEAMRGLDAVATLVVADLEAGPWPLMQEGQPRTFDAVVVTHYLWRPRLAQLARSLAPGGVLIYETFASGQASVGRPSNPDFLLQPGELLRAFDGLRVVAYEDGFLQAPERFVQRLCAVRQAEHPDPTPARYPLWVE